jgi:hypothetical protein
VKRYYGQDPGQDQLYVRKKWWKSSGLSEIEWEATMGAEAVGGLADSCACEGYLLGDGHLQHSAMHPCP